MFEFIFYGLGFPFLIYELLCLMEFNAIKRMRTYLDQAYTMFEDKTKSEEDLNQFRRDFVMEECSKSTTSFGIAIFVTRYALFIETVYLTWIWIGTTWTTQTSIFWIILIMSLFKSRTPPDAYRKFDSIVSAVLILFILINFSYWQIPFKMDELVIKIWHNLT